MIIYCKKEDVTTLIEKLEEVETKFWLEYKFRSKSNRDYLVKAFEDMYKKLYELIEGKQLEIQIKENENG